MRLDNGSLTLIGTPSAPRSAVNADVRSNQPAKDSTLRISTFRRHRFDAQWWLNNAKRQAAATRFRAAIGFLLEPASTAHPAQTTPALRRS